MKCLNFNNKIKFILLFVLVLIAIIICFIYLKKTENTSAGLTVDSSKNNLAELTPATNKEDKEYILDDLSFRVPAEYNLIDESEENSKMQFSNLDDVYAYSLIAQTTSYSEGTEEEILKRLEEENYGIDETTMENCTGLLKETINDEEWNVVRVKSNLNEMVTYEECYYGFHNEKFYIVVVSSGTSQTTEDSEGGIRSMKSIIDSLQFNQ